VRIEASAVNCAVDSRVDVVEFVSRDLSKSPKVVEKAVEMEDEILGVLSAEIALVEG
jgi:hypothetical protein